MMLEKHSHHRKLSQVNTCMRSHASAQPDSAQRTLCHIWMQDTAQHLYALPERGSLLLREIEQQLSADDWDLTEKALLALKSLMHMPGALQLFQVPSQLRQRQLSKCCVVL